MNEQEIARLLAELEGDWELVEDKLLRRQFTLADFAAAIAFVDEVAALAEAKNHHPDIHVTGYKNVTIELTTHSADGLSKKDFDLARAIEAL